MPVQQPLDRETPQAQPRRGLISRIWGKNRPDEMHIFDDTPSRTAQQPQSSNPWQKPVPQPADTARPDASVYARPAEDQPAHTGRTAPMAPVRTGEEPVGQNTSSRQNDVSRPSSSRPITSRVRNNIYGRPSPADEADEGDVRYQEPPRPARAGVQQPRNSWDVDEADPQDTDEPIVVDRRDMKVPRTQTQSPSYVPPLDIKAPADDK